MWKTTRLAVLVSGDILIAFAIQWYVLVVFGPGAETDAFIASMTIPMLVIGVVSMSLVRVLVPYLASKEIDEHHSIVWGILVVVFFFFSLLAIILAVFAALWVGILFPGFSEEAKSLTVELARIQLSAMIITAMSAVFISSWQSRNCFIRVELIQLISHAVMLGAMIVLVSDYGIEAVAWIGLFRGFVTLILLFPGFSSRSLVVPNFSWVPSIWLRLRPLLVGSSVYKTAPLLDRYLASLAPSGALSVFVLSQNLYSSAAQFVDRVAVAPIVPRLAKYSSDEDWAGFSRLWSRRLILLSAFVVFSYLVLVLVGLRLIEEIFVHESFDVDDAVLLWEIMVHLGGFIIGAVIGQVLSGAFYAMGDTSTPTQIGLIGFFVGVMTKVLGFYYGGILGLSLGTSLYYLINSLILWWFLSKHDRSMRVG